MTQAERNNPIEVSGKRRPAMIEAAAPVRRQDILIF
jgi:hypothetical protein